MLKKTSFDALKKLTPQDRVKAMETSFGPTVLSLLTPSQMADLFPRYYQKALPDISGFRAAVTQSTQKKQADFQKIVADQLGIDPATGRRKGGWLEKMGEEYKPGGRYAPGGKDYKKPLSSTEKAIKDATGIDITAGSDQAELKGDAKKLFEDLKAGRVPLDDPRAAVFKRMSPKDFAAAGLKVEDVDGKQFVKMAPVEVTEEQIQKFAPGRYRPKYNLKDSDLSDEVVNTIAGEVSANNKKGVDAVINVLMNRVGSKKYAGSESLQGLVSAPEQFKGYNKGRPTKEQAEFIRERIRAIASGSEPDITGGANEFRAKSYVFGDGKGKEFYRDAEKQGFIDIGGNIYANRSKTGSPYASYVHSGEQPPPATLTSEQRKAAEEKAKENVLQERGQAFAAGTIEPPPGLSDKALEEFKKMPPGEQQRFSDAFYKMGGTPEAAKKLNESVEKYGSATVSVLSGKGMYETSEDAKSFLRKVDVIGDSKTIMKNYGFDPIDSMNNKTSLSFANALQRYNDYAIKNGLPEARLTSGARFPLPGMPGGMANKSNSLHAGGFAGDVVFVNRQGLSLGLNKGPHDVFQKFAKEEGLFWGKEIYGDHEVHHYQSYSGKTNPYSSKYDSRGVPLDPEFLKNVDITTGQPWINPTIIKKVEEVKKEEEQKSNVNVTSEEAPPLKPEYEPKPISPWEYAGHKVSQKEDTTATVTKSVEKPKPEPEPKPVKYKFNEAEFIKEVRAKETGAMFVSDEYIMGETIKGFKDTPGVKYDRKSGTLTIEDPNSPAIQTIIDDMKSHGFNQDKFLHKQEGKQSQLEPTTQTAAVSKPQKSGMFDFIQSAQAQELDLSDPNVRAAIKAQHESGAKSNLVNYENSKTARALGMSNEQYTAFRKAITGIESGGGDWRSMKYNIRGGSSNRFSGAYQMGGGEIKDVAKRLGEEAPVMKMGRKTVASEAFLNDPHMQERYFDEYMLSHHESLMRRNKKYKNMSPEQQMHALAVSHNAGAGGASRWINTSKTSKDAFDTDPTKYSKALDQQFAELKAQQEQKTQVAAAQPVTPIQQPTPTSGPTPAPEPSFTERAKSALGLKSATAETRPAEPKPAPAPSGPEFPKTPKTGETPTPPQRPMEISPVKQAQELGKPDESSTKKFLESEGIGKKEVEHIPAKAYGGDVEASQEVSAYPINGLRGDNTLAVDTKTQQPLFTFNPDKEAVVPNGENNSASVIPTNKITGSFEGQKQTNIIDELNNMKMQMQDMMQNVGRPDVKPPSGEREIPENRNPNFLENILQQPRTPYQNPTFYRAMSRAKGFAETGDAVDGNHYSWGNRL